VHGLKSRAAFKLLQINDKYKIFKRGNTVVDLGYAPGSWSQVAVSKTQPNGRVIGVDILPAQPPRGVSTIQGDFLSPEIQAEVRSYVLDHERGRAKKRSIFVTEEEAKHDARDSEEETISSPSYLELERQADLDMSKQRESTSMSDLEDNMSKLDLEHMSRTQRDEAAGRVVDVVLSDMCEPWEQISGFGKRSISDPYNRMMNTSGTPFRDHAGSMV
jgi:21S rRNA (uridine2791-2'-O)-methyltransferase